MNIKQELPNEKALIDMIKHNSPVQYETLLQKVAWVEDNTKSKPMFLADSEILRMAFETVATVEIVEDRIKDRKFTADTTTVFFANLNTSVYDADTVTPPSVTEQARTLIDHSELLVERKTLSRVDDVFNVELDSRRLAFAEFSGSVEFNRNGLLKFLLGKKQEGYIGYFCVYQLPKSYEGRTFLSTVNRRGPWSHKYFWDISLSRRGISEVSLEWNDFSDIIHVAADNQIVVREILTPDFMLDLYTWWKKDKSNIRISFIGDRMCVLFPAMPLHASMSKEECLGSAVDPALHLLHLTQDVYNRFR